MQKLLDLLGSASPVMLFLDSSKKFKKAQQMPVEKWDPLPPKHKQKIKDLIALKNTETLSPLTSEQCEPLYAEIQKLMVQKDVPKTEDTPEAKTEDTPEPNTEDTPEPNTEDRRRKTRPSQTRKTRPSQTRKTRPSQTRKTRLKRRRKTRPKRRRKTRPSQTRKTRPKRRRKTFKLVQKKKRAVSA